MHEKNKNPLPALILIGLFLLFIPFVFIKDFYPFMRLGMFAEPVNNRVQLEVFYISINDSTKVNSLHFGIPPANFQYLCRNYHYREQEILFLKKIAQSQPSESSFYFYKIVEQDTFMLAKYEP